MSSGTIATSAGIQTSASNVYIPTPTPSSPNRTVDEILHILTFVGISMAALFVKNPQHINKAGQIADLLQNKLLPIADSLLGQDSSASAG